MPAITQARLTRVLGGGALAFGVLGLARPAVLARLMESSDETAREIGVRDTALGVFALTRDKLR